MLIIQNFSRGKQIFRRQQIFCSKFSRFSTLSDESGIAYKYKPIRVRHNSKTEYEPKPTTLQIGTGLALVCVIVKLGMMYDETQEPERIAYRARELAKAQEKIEPMTREKWDALQKIRPHTPFESQFARDGSRIRTGEPLKWVDFRSWAVDTLFDRMKQNEMASSYEIVDEDKLLEKNE